MSLDLFIYSHFEGHLDFWDYSESLHLPVAHIFLNRNNA